MLRRMLWVFEVLVLMRNGEIYLLVSAALRWDFAIAGRNG